jgi:putative ABC transport system permease protein
MSLYSRLKNVFRRDRLNSELDEELRLHLEEAIASGRDPEEARRALGIPIHHREASRDIFVSQWLENLWSDLTFGLRQIRKNKVTSAAAIVSLALAIGACTASFQLIDALLLRPLPVANPERLFLITNSYIKEDGTKDYGDSSSYPQFRTLREAVRQEAELLSIDASHRADLTYGSDAEMERAYRQRISGWTFQALGIQPALGRLLNESDDQKPGAHPVAVISYDYWQSRFGRDTSVLGRTFRIANDTYEIVGVAPKGFTGTETGTPTSIFVPSMMNTKAIYEPGWSWFRSWLVFKPGANHEVARQKIEAVIRVIRAERAKQFAPTTPKSRIEQFLSTDVVLRPAAAGISGAQRKYRQALSVLAVLVILLLGIACANVANLMTAQAASRAREMALRVSIGAGRLRLLQLVIAESLILATVAAILGYAFSLWAAPAVMSRINPPDNPFQLALSMDLRILAFLLVMTILVTVLFGLAPALRASSIRPSAALKGGEDPHSRRRLMHALIAAQVAFCFIVHFTAGLFFASYDRMASQPTGFDSEQLLVLSVTSNSNQPQAHWDQLSSHLSQLPGVVSAASSRWALMSNSSWSNDISVNGEQPLPVAPNFLSISPNWLHTMKIPLLEGRDFRPSDASPGAAIVNQTFAKKYFAGQNPIGKSFEKLDQAKRIRYEIIGVAHDARYAEMREAIPATIYVAIPSLDNKGQITARDSNTYLVRTATADPLLLAESLRKEVTKVQPSMRVSNITTQKELVEQHTVRERLLALLGGFFAIVALILSAVGLYGVLNYSVLQRRREFGIRLALGAHPSNLVWNVSVEVFGMLLLGALSGLLLGLASERFLKDLLFGVKTTDWQMLALPLATILIAALLAAVLPILRAIRIDPGSMLRSE